MSRADARGAAAGPSEEWAELDFRCPLTSGLHVRPASHLAEAASAFDCAIELVAESGRRANAKSVVAMVALDVRHDEPCRLVLRGRDAGLARSALESFVREVLPGCDAPVGEALLPGELALPRVLAEAGVRPLRGVAACSGIGRGRVVLARARVQPEPGFLDAGGTPEAERERVRRALAELRARLAIELGAGPSATEADILKAHANLARDVALAEAIERPIAAGCAAPRAVWEACQELAGMLLRSESGLVRERALDIEDLCYQLLEHLGSGELVPERPLLEEPAVVFADRLAPRQLLELDRRYLRGLVLTSAGATSHAIILARSFGIPTLTDVTQAQAELAPGTAVVVDADLGIVLAEEDERVRRYYQRRLDSRARRQAQLVRGASEPGHTRDGRRVEVAANVGSLAELESAFGCGAEGIGLLRTEMLFLDRDVAPSEEEQLAFLTRALEAAAGRGVIVRSLDVGGDKPLPYLGLPAEPNPFLGRRGVRLYPELGALIDAQLRAILRAAARGPLRLMVPMVSDASELAWVRQRVAALRAELRAASLACAEELPIGIMLEVPSAAYDLERLTASADFFSLGTNDLAQYFFAADRENERVARLHDPLQPAFLRFLRATVAELRGRGRWVGICGEMARDPLALPLLVGLGVDELSLAAPAVPALKRALASLDGARCSALLERACACGAASEVRALLTSAREPSPALPLCSRDLIVLDSGAASRAEAIQELVELVHAGFRCDDPLALERAVWEREQTYSTGLGGGFAIPHCKSAALDATTLAVLRLARPVEWEALDGEPVRCALLLAVRSSDDERAHMRTLSKLARKLVDETFRAELLAAPDPDALLSCLSRELELGS